MKPITSKATKVANNPWFMVVAGLSSIIAFVGYLYDKTTPEPSTLGLAALVCTLAILSIGYVYSIKVRSENIALRGLSEVFYEINLIYKNTLYQLFSGSAPVTNPTDLLTEEERVLRSVCQRIENIFASVIGRNCMVTVKLITKENSKYYAHTYVRSQELSKRDSSEKLKFVVGTGDNNGFDKALSNRSDGLPLHFYSPDLQKDTDYSNQRQHYYRHYRSTLVVPICGENKGKEGTPDQFDRVGFLCVDTLSTNRLNNRYHLYMLSALANQMYNFMSLMRGKYTVFVG